MKLFVRHGIETIFWKVERMNLYSEWNGIEYVSIYTHVICTCTCHMHMKKIGSMDEEMKEMFLKIDCHKHEVCG